MMLHMIENKRPANNGRQTKNSLAVLSVSGPSRCAVRVPTMSGEGSRPSRSILIAAPNSAGNTARGFETNPRLVIASQSAKRIVSESHLESKAHSDLPLLQSEREEVR